MTIHWYERARQRSKELKLSLTKLSDITGWSRASVCMWVNGEREPKLEQKMALADALGVTVHWLDTGENALEALQLPTISLEDVASWLNEKADKQRALEQDPGIRIIDTGLENSFLVRLDNDTMVDLMNGEKKHIPEGGVVQIEVEYEPSPGNILLVKHNDAMVLRLWKRVDDNLHHLKVISPHYPNLNFTYEGPISDIYRGTAVGYSDSLI